MHASRRRPCSKQAAYCARRKACALEDASAKKTTDTKVEGRRAGTMAPCTRTARCAHAWAARSCVARTYHGSNAVGWREGGQQRFQQLQQLGRLLRLRLVAQLRADVQVVHQQLLQGRVWPRRQRRLLLQDNVQLVTWLLLLLLLQGKVRLRMVIGLLQACVPLLLLLLLLLVVVALALWTPTLLRACLLQQARPLLWVRVHWPLQVRLGRRIQLTLALRLLQGGETGGARLGHSRGLHGAGIPPIKERSAARGKGALHHGHGRRAAGCKRVHGWPAGCQSAVVRGNRGGGAAPWPAACWAGALPALGLAGGSGAQRGCGWRQRGWTRRRASSSAGRYGE